MKNKISVEDFGIIHNGKKAHLFTVKRENISFCVTDYGCSITSLNIKNSSGSFTDVVLGLETLSGYACSWGSFGAVIGRFSNRIMKAGFELNGKNYKLTENTEGACLHGGFPASALQKASCGRYRVESFRSYRQTYCPGKSYLGCKKNTEKRLQRNLFHKNI